MEPWTNKSLCLIIAGLFLVGLGTSFCFLRSTIFHMILQKGLALSPTSKSFDVWKDSSSLPPMYFNIHFFNWTNPEELGIPGKKPHFVQLGPYVFREVRQKVNITFHPENKTVSYLQKRIWYFDAERTNGSLSDPVSHLNIVATSAAHKVRYWDYSLQKSLSFLMSSRIYIVKTVEELLFTGYSDNLLLMGKLMVTDEDIPSYDRFGWFYMRNGSSNMDGHFNVETGQDDIGQLGIIRNWNYRDTLKHYKTPCNILEGSAGEFWPPNRTKDEITLFSSELCRPLIYEYEQTDSHMGIKSYRYALDKKTLGNDTRRRYPHEQAKFFEPTTTTEDFFAAEHSNEFTGFFTATESISSDERSSKSNLDEYSDDDPDVINMGHCYCSGECTPTGLMNLTACRYGAPVFASLPHFYKADPSLLDQVEGLTPNEEEHSFSITLEPTTGLLLKVAARLQINILLQPSELVSLFNDVPKIYLPVLWFSLKTEVNEEMATGLKYLLAIPTVTLCTGVIMAIIGLCLIGVVALLRFVKKQHIPSIDTAAEKAINEPLENKMEMVYMDKINANEEANIRSDRRLYEKLH